MNKIKQSFFSQLSVVFLFLILVLGIAFFYLGERNSNQLLIETFQKVNRDLAIDLAAEFQPFLINGIQSDSIQAKIVYLKGINPQVDIYLLGSNGMIKGHFPGAFSPKELQTTTVETAKLDAFMDGQALPILGLDPLNPNSEKPFSVTDIEIMGEKGCYLYVILGGQDFEKTASMTRNSYILENSIIGLGLILFVTALVGLGLFSLLTKRLKNMTKIIAAFEQGQLDKRIDIHSKDEIGLLATSFNQMADTLVQNMSEIKKVDSLRRELVANVSHDLRSPLASIQGYLELIQQKEQLSEKDRTKYIDIVIRNTKRLGTLISELFELSKLDAHEIKPHLEPVSFAELTQDLVLKFKPLAEAKGVSIDADIPEESLKLVQADIALLERAISNLIDNSIKHTPEGGAVSVRPYMEDGMVYLSIKDTGKGIPEKDIEHVFDRFYQVEKSRSNKAGAGLGLAIAKKIIDLHGGSIAVSSKIEFGTSFNIGLQINPA